jgi:hypothetical protein
VKNLNWVDDLILPFSVAALQAAWVTLWLRWADRFVTLADPVIYPGPLAMIGLAAGGAYLTRFALGRIADLNRARLAVLAAGLAAVALTAWAAYPAGFPASFLRGLFVWRPTVTPQFLGFLAAVFLWSRGILVGRSRIPHQMLEDAFYGGLGALAVLLLLNQLTPFLARLEALWGIVIFFAVGLGTLALASLERARRKQAAAAGALPALNRQWLLTIAAVIGAVIFGGLAVAGWVAPETFTRAAELISPYLDQALYYLLVVVALIGFAIAWVLAPVVQWLIDHLANLPFLLHLPEPPAFMQNADDAARAFLQSPGVRLAGRGALTLLVAAAVLALFWYAVRRFTRSGAREVDETRESILSADLLLAQLRDLFRRGGSGPGQAAAPYLNLGPGDDPRRVIRRAYQGLLEWTRGFTLERRPGQTPAGFARELGGLLPDERDAITILTAAYEHARYAAEAPAPAEAEAARQALEKLKTTGRPARLAPPPIQGAS